MVSLCSTQAVNFVFTNFPPLIYIKIDKYSHLDMYVTLKDLIKINKNGKKPFALANIKFSDIFAIFDENENFSY